MPSINEYLRRTFNNHVRPLLIRDECAICGCTENLHLHHYSHKHCEICNDIMKDLSLNPNSYVSELTDLQLKIIEEIYIGRSLSYVTYYTLCKECHLQAHGENDIFFKKNITSRSYDIKMQNKYLVKDIKNIEKTFDEMLNKIDHLTNENIKLMNKDKNESYNELLGDYNEIKG